MAKSRRKPKPKTHALKGIDDLNPAPYNPREISVTAQDGLSKSVNEFGDLSGIVWNKRTGNLVSGHQRVTVLRNAGAIYLSDPHRLLLGDREFPIRVVDWDSETEKAANLAANNQAIQGMFTAEVDLIIAEIEAANPELHDGLLLGAIVGEPTTTTEPGASGETDLGGGPAQMELQPFEHYDYVVIMATDTMDWEWLCEKFGIKKVNASPIPGKKKIGLGRAISAKRAIKAIKGE